MIGHSLYQARFSTLAVYCHNLDSSNQPLHAGVNTQVVRDIFHPPLLQDIELTMKETENVYLFWRHQFGQWTKRDISDIDGTIYNCCEQYMMAKKALLFGDTLTQAAIMKTASAKEQQALGRQVANFDASKWDKHKYGIVWFANYLKFSQHDDLAARLLATNNKVLAEASPYDLVWGIGFTAEDEQALNTKAWTGQNLLGKVLMSVREALVKEVL